ncbi:MAG: hypothetical protein HFF81_10325 [Oscillospiraceae bacterium]|nr:hypothetical protein [Oscillospiraceae bacterium]
MLLYAVLMFSVSILFTVLSMMIYRGKTDLIHSYHQARVKDKAAYGRAFGKALLGIALAPFISGVIGLCGDSDLLAVTAVVVLLSGLALGFCGILAVQRRYNKGLF